MCKVIGIDISNQTFDVGCMDEATNIHKQYSNDLKGYKALNKLIAPMGCVRLVMEASGPYYLALASYFHSIGVEVSVVNPLVVRRFSQMKLYRAKTDKKDAFTIMQYGVSQWKDLSLWQPPSKEILELQQLHTVLDLLDKQLVQSKNQWHALERTQKVSATLKRFALKHIKELKKKVAQIEQKIIHLAKTHYKENFELLTSIPGIGPKSASMLIVVTGNFEKFEHYKQLIAHVGLSPGVYQSGTSVKGKAGICKRGNPRIRKLLYMCSWSAKFCNKPCREMYARLAKKGKPERVIKIALANKILKQAFAVANKKQKFVENYQPKICF